MMTTKTTGDYVNILKGTRVIVEDVEGQLYSGILRGLTNELEVELSFAHKIPIPEEAAFILSNANAKKCLKLKAARLSGDYQAQRRDRAFRTDGEIGINGKEVDQFPDEEFQHWEDDGGEGMDEIGELEDQGKEPVNGKMKKRSKNSGWTVEDMFEANKDKCVGESSFDENLTQYSNVEIGRRTKEQLQKADELARQIEMNPVSKRNALLENDDEERDLDALTKFKEEDRPKQQKRRENHAKANKEREHHQEKPPTPRTAPLKTESVKSEEKSEVQKQPTEQEQQRVEPVEVKKEERQASNSPKEGHKEQEEAKKSKFTFNPAATPFIPKQNVSSNPSPHTFQQPPLPTPVSVNNFNNNTPSQSHTFIQTVPLPPNAQIPQVLSHPNLAYNNALVYPPQQPQQAVLPNAIPLYATYTGNPAATGAAQLQPTAVIVHPNHQQAFIIQQPGVPQQFVPVTTPIMPPQNHQHSRTGTPTNGPQVLQPTQQTLIDATTGNPLIQHPFQTTPIYHNPVQSAQTGSAVLTGALPLMNIPQLPPQQQAMIQVPANSMGAAYTHQPQQYINGANYAPHHPQLAITYSQPQQQMQAHQQPHHLSRSNSVQPQQPFQPVNMQHAPQALPGIYNVNTPPHAAHPLLQQQTQCQVPYYVPPNTAVIPPPTSTMQPHLTHTNIPPPMGHGTANNIGRPPQQQY